MTERQVLLAFLALTAGRVIVNDHFLSDVLASAAIAALLTFALGKFFLRRIATPAPSPSA